MSHAATPGHGRPTIPPAAALAKLPRDGGPDWNRLVFEQSPYLLQHAANPVDWWPWTDAAFAEARRRNVPVFLSIGYSTCHWCHVMEKESFEDEEVAKLLNDTFVCIKVDREERPDLDAVYMSVTQAMTGSGGWPMTVILTPDRQPFHAGTYFPKHGRYGRPGMLELIPGLAQYWKDNPAGAVERAGQMVQHLASLMGGSPGGDLDATTLDLAQRQLASRYDAEKGGFGTSPKFPTPHVLNFLLRWWKRSGDARALEMVDRTLIAMARGGIHDHLGFGFARYSTDREWLVPHFEKMLYDQALLALAYVDAYQASGTPAHAEVARNIFRYVLRDMTAPEGGFYSAEDADSEGVEGKFYVWSPAQITALLGPEEGRLACEAWGVTATGNFHEVPGSSILHLPATLADFAAARKLKLSDVETRLERSRQALFTAREKRVHPFKDDKVLTDWNGLMIAALARGSVVLKDPQLAAAAAKAATFTLTHLRDDKGRLLKRWRAGEAGLPAHLEDHAFLAWGLLELHEATLDPKWLDEALQLSDTTIARFWDPQDGGFFLTASDGEALIARPKEVYDGALPSGNSAMALVLVRLARLTGREDLEDKAAATFRAFSGALARGPSSSALMMQALDLALGPSYEVVIVGQPDAPDTQAMLAALQADYRPNKVVLLRRAGGDPLLDKLAPFTRAQAAIGGQATAYVCRNFACSLPTTDPQRMLALMSGTAAPAPATPEGKQKP